MGKSLLRRETSAGLGSKELPDEFQKVNEGQYPEHWRSLTQAQGVLDATEEAAAGKRPWAFIWKVDSPPPNLTEAIAVLREYLGKFEGRVPKICASQR